MQNYNPVNFEALARKKLILLNLRLKSKNLRSHSIGKENAPQFVFFIYQNLWESF
jgi:hypothetical protein